MDRSYIDAACGGGGWSWCGFRLSRVRVADVLALAYLESPLLGGGPLQAADLVAAAWVLSAPDAPARSARLHDRLSLCQRLQLRWRAVRYGRGAAGYEAAFVGWWLDQTGGPQVLCEAGKSRRLSSPWVELLVQRVTATGVPRMEVLEMPLTEALWVQLVAQERDGAQVKIVDEALREKFRAAGYTEEEVMGLTRGDRQ